MRALLVITVISFLWQPITVLGQTALVPDWIQTKPYGAGQNGRLSVDPSNGSIHWLLSEDNGSFLVPHAEHYIYDQTGNDLTPIPPDLLELYVNGGAIERGSVEDPSISNDTLVLSVFDQLAIGYDRTTLTEWGPNGVARTITWFGENNTSELMDLHKDDLGMVSIVDQARRYVQAFDEDWLPLWQNYAGGQQHSVTANTDKVFLARLPQVTVFDRANGDSLTMFNVNNSSLASAGVVLFQDNSLFHAYQVNDTMHVGRSDLSGNSLWDRSLFLGDGFDANEIIVDPQGAVWVSSSLDTDINLDHADGGRLISVDPSGTYISYFTFGSTMTDMSYDNGTVFLCGKLDQGATTSYLIAVQPDIATAVSTQDPGFEFNIYPNPAKDRSFVQLSGQHVVEKLNIRDLFGRVMHTQSISGQTSVVEVELGEIAKGVYLIELLDGNGASYSRTLVVD